MRHVTDGELHAFLDGSLDLLPDGRGSEVRDHISSCSVCQERLQDEEDVRARAQDLLRGSPLPEVALPSFEELRERAAAPAPPSPGADSEEADTTRYRGPLRGVPLAWAATIVLALGVGWMGGQVGRSIPEGRPLAPATSRFQEPDVSSLQRVDLNSESEESGEPQALPTEINSPGSSEPGVGAQEEGLGQARSRVVAPAGSVAVEDMGSRREGEAQGQVAKPSDSAAAVDLVGSSAKVLSEPLFEDQARSASGSPGRALLAEASPRTEGNVSESESPIPDSLENSLAIPGLKVVSIEWEERVAGEKALLIRQLLSPGDTLELRYLGMLLSADAEAGVHREGRASPEDPGGRMYANVLEASLPAGWHQVVMEWGRGLLVARAPVTEQNLKALLKSLR